VIVCDGCVWFNGGVIQFNFAQGIVTTPDGQTYVDIPVKVRDGWLYWWVNGGDFSIELQSGWAEASTSYGMQDVNGGVWWVKRSGGCGCGG